MSTNVQPPQINQQINSQLNDPNLQRLLTNVTGFNFSKVFEISYLINILSTIDFDRITKKKRYIVAFVVILMSNEIIEFIKFIWSNNNESVRYFASDLWNKIINLFGCITSEKNGVCMITDIMSDKICDGATDSSMSIMYNTTPQMVRQLYKYCEKFGSVVKNQNGHVIDTVSMQEHDVSINVMKMSCSCENFDISIDTDVLISSGGIKEKIYKPYEFTLKLPNRLQIGSLSAELADISVFNSCYQKLSKSMSNAPWTAKWIAENTILTMEQAYIVVANYVNCNNLYKNIYRKNGIVSVSYIADTNTTYVCNFIEQGTTSIDCNCTDTINTILGGITMFLANNIGTTDERLSKYYKKNIGYEQKTMDKIKLPITISNIKNRDLDTTSCVHNWLSNNVATYDIKVGKKINIHAIKYEKTQETQTIDNPAYAEWKQLYDNVTSSSSTTKGSDAIELLKIQPEKIKTVTTTTKKIVTTKVKEDYKDINTIYLRECDSYFYDVIDKFKNSPEIYETCGIQYKLGICLYGLPGTGKTTISRGVASYFGRDLYYLRIDNDTTNQEFLDMCKHIEVNCKNGIILFEDIDAMTNIVVDRGISHESNLCSTIETMNDALTLETLLNIFDGTLTNDGLIYIITTNHVDHLDPALIRPGRIDVKMHMKCCDKSQLKKIYFKFFNERLDTEILDRFIEDKFTPSQIIQTCFAHYLNKNIDADVVLKDYLS